MALTPTSAPNVSTTTNPEAVEQADPARIVGADDEPDHAQPELLERVLEQQVHRLLAVTLAPELRLAQDQADLGGGLRDDGTESSAPNQAPRQELDSDRKIRSLVTAGLSEERLDFVQREAAFTSERQVLRDRAVREPFEARSSVLGTRAPHALGVAPRARCPS